MKTIPLVFANFLILALALTATAQTQSPQAPETLLADVAKARCAYSPADANCIASTANPAARDATGTNTLAQVARRPPARYPAPRRQSMGYPYPVYPPGPPAVSGRHVAIGAAIGFAFGVVAGSRNSAGSALALGTVTAGVGALVGLMVPAFPQRPFYPSPDDDEEAHRHGRHRPKSSVLAGASHPRPVTGSPGD